MNRVECLRILKSYHQRGFSLVPLKPRSKIPLVKWKHYQLTNEDFFRFLAQNSNWAVRCDESFHVLDFDDPGKYEGFVQGEGTILRDAPTIRTARGFHVWFKPKRPVNSFSTDGIEIKGLGSLVVVPPSIHPCGIEYKFEKPFNGNLPVIDIEKLLDFDSSGRGAEGQPVGEDTPSDFALRYGKSPYPQSLCGKATKVLTRSDDEVKHLLSLRCWKWHCQKCAQLLKRYWLKKLAGVSFRFIIRLPDVSKPTALVRHLGKPDYVHIVANGESWLFLAGGIAEDVWVEAEKAGYELIAGDAAGDPSPEELRECLEIALCLEEEPLNTRRKITHSRGLFNKITQDIQDNESKQNSEFEEGEEKMKAKAGNESLTWDSTVLMKSIEQVAKELEAEGWHILWISEVEAIAVRDKKLSRDDMDIVDLLESLGVRLRKTGSEYMGLCPFHPDHDPSLSVNREKGLWHCFGCRRGGDVRKLVEEWQNRGKRDQGS